MATIEVFSSAEEMKADRKVRKLTKEEKIRQKNAAASLVIIKKKKDNIL
jgi:hypothetical protein